MSEMLSLFQQCLHQGTANTAVAVSVDSVGEPRTVNAELGGVAALYYAVVSLTSLPPLLSWHACKYACTTPGQ